MIMEKFMPKKQKKLKASNALVKFKALLKDIQEDLDKNINLDFHSLTNLQASSKELKILRLRILNRSALVWYVKSLQYIHVQS